MRLTAVEWMRLVLSLSLASVFSFLVVVIFSPNVEGQPESINVQNTVVTAPLTVVVPITADVQNAQICASVASSGDQSCTQVVLNPEQTSYTDVDVDLSTATPTLTTAEQEPTTATTEPAPTTTTETTPTTSTTEPAPTEEPTTDTGTEEGGTTTEEPATETDTAEEPSTDGGASEGGTE